MSERLTTLVRGSNDLVLLDYVLQHLTEGLSPKQLKQATYIPGPLRAALQRKLEILAVPLATLNRYTQEEGLAALRRALSDFLATNEETVRDLARSDRERLRAKLRDTNILVRLQALQAISLARPHLEADLIALLDDRNRDLRALAHKTLVRVARGTDLGPAPGASHRDRLTATRRWTTWLQLQDGAAAGSGLHPALLPGLRVADVSHPEKQGPAAPAEDARREAARLVRAPAEKQAEVLADLRDRKGALYTEALALAIPQLPGARKARARNAQAERLTRMKAKTMDDKLHDEDAEVRRAAALACAMKDSRIHIPQLLTLLEDPEESVTQSARAALKKFSKKDFGPRLGAPHPERVLAGAAWRAWWHQDETRRQARR